MAASASGAGGGAVAASRAKADPRARRMTLRALLRIKLRSPLRATAKKARKTPLRMARFAPTRRPAESGGRAVAGVVADVGVAALRMVWSDRLPTNSDRHRRR